MNDWSENIVRLSDIRQKKLNASSVFGPLRVGLTTSRTTHDQALSELLSDLERKVDDLISKSFTVLHTLSIATEGARVALSVGGMNENGTDTI